MKDVKQKMKDLNVQLDNLCQVCFCSPSNFLHLQSSHPVAFDYTLCHAAKATSGFLQFLPQDKVVEFARLSPTELLRETQKAIGDSRLADLHKELIEKNKACNMSSRVSRASPVCTADYV